MQPLPSQTLQYCKPRTKQRLIDWIMLEKKQSSTRETSPTIKIATSNCENNPQLF